MIFKKENFIGLLSLGLIFLVGCTKEEDTDLIRQQYQLNELNIIGIEIEPALKFALRQNAGAQFEAYGLVAENVRLTNEDGTVQKITEKVSWKVSDSTLAKISSKGRFTSLNNNGEVQVTATFAGLESSSEVVVTDSPLESITIKPNDFVDVCQNLQLEAEGVLKDGNLVPLESGLIWTTTQTTEGTIVAEFKKNTIADLSTYRAGAVTVRAEDKNSAVKSLPMSIVVSGSLQSISLTSENSVESGKSITVKAIGEYANKSVDISANSKFLSRDTTLATFGVNTNVLTAKSGVANQASVNVEITGTCNLIEGTKTITIVKPST